MIFMVKQLVIQLTSCSTMVSDQKQGALFKYAAVMNNECLLWLGLSPLENEEVNLMCLN